MSGVDWDGDHCYCMCDICMPESDEQAELNEEMREECEQELYCVPHGICGCTDHMEGEELVDHIEGFISLIAEKEHGWYHKMIPRLKIEILMIKLNIKGVTNVK